MKRTVNSVLTLILLCVFSLGSLNAQDLAMSNSAKKVAVINFETEVVDYGTIAQNSDGLRVFKFTNTGNAPLVITDVKTSCGCTVPTYSKEPILPGQEGSLDIKYNTKKLGTFTKTVTVISNAEGGNKILKIKGNVIASN